MTFLCPSVVVLVVWAFFPKVTVRWVKAEAKMTLGKKDWINIVVQELQEKINLIFCLRPTPHGPDFPPQQPHSRTP